jgi:hypothetical protein
MRGLGLGLGLSSLTPEQRIAVPSPLPIIRESVSDFTAGSSWLLTALTVNDDASPNYEESGSADQTRSDNSTGLHGLGRTGNLLVMGVTYYADLVLKPDGRNHLLFQISGSGMNHYAMVDLLTNTMGDSSGDVTVTVSDLSDGWKFVRMQFAAAAGVLHACNLFHATGSTLADYPNVVGDITKGLLLDRYVLSRNP